MNDNTTAKKEFPFAHTIILTGLSLLLAYILKWDLADLMWSFWFGSITLAVTRFLFFILGLAIKSEGSLPQKIYGAVMSLLILGGFMGMYFVTIHYILAGMLDGLFPVKEVAIDFKTFYKFYLFMLNKYIFFLPFIFWEERENFTTKNIPKINPDSENPYEGNTLMAKAIFREFLSPFKLWVIIILIALMSLMKFNTYVIYAASYLILFTQWTKMPFWQKIKLKL